VVSAVVPFVTLTDVELAVLEEAHLRSLGEAEDRARQDPRSDGEVRRSLRARGLLTADGGLVAGTDQGDGPPDLAGVVGLALDVRLAADLVVVAHRLLGPQAVGSARVLHLTGDGACVEDLDEDGLVSLSLATDPGQVAGSLVEALLPPDAVDGTGEPVPVRPDALGTLPAALRGPTVLAELTVLVPGEPAPVAPTRVLLALGPGGCWAGRAGAPGDGEVLLHPVPASWLADRAALTVEAAMGAPGPGPGDGTMER
jgi:hypothetical protein